MITAVQLQEPELVMATGYRTTSTECTELQHTCVVDSVDLAELYAVKTVLFYPAY